MDKIALANELTKLAKELLSDKRTAAKTETVTIDWNNTKSIQKAERKKLSLENKGYSLIKTIGGLTTSKLVYELK